MMDIRNKTQMAQHFLSSDAAKALFGRSKEPLRRQCLEALALMERKEQGLVAELPCRVGDMVYSLNWSIMNNRYLVRKGTIVNVRYDASDGLVTVSDGESYFKWGVKAFATPEEAEDAAAPKGERNEIKL